MKRVRLAAAAAGCAVVLALAAVASAAAPAGGTIGIFVAGGSPSHQNVVVAGAIGDYGTATSVDASGKANPNGSFELIKLQKGSFLVNATNFNAAGNRARPFLSSNTTCSAAVSWSGTVSIVSGTGLYKGITGTLKLRGTFVGISARLKSGPHKGQCQRDQSAAPKSVFVSVTGAGKVTLG